MWNIQPCMQSLSSNASNIPVVKVEPCKYKYHIIEKELLIKAHLPSVLSPNYYGSLYRSTYLRTPSPQPTSPMMNRSINTPSPGLMRNSSAESQTQMSNLYNQSQVNQDQFQNLANNFNLTTITRSPTSGAAVGTDSSKHLLKKTNTIYSNDYNINNPQQQTQFTAANIIVNRTSGGSFTPIYFDDNCNKIHNTVTNNNNINNLEFQTANVTNSIQEMQTVFGTTNNNIFNQFQDSNATTSDPSVFNLSQLEDLVPLQNSEELRISNLSIST